MSNPAGASSSSPASANNAAAVTPLARDTDIFTLESFSPVFIASWERETGICSICRNQVEGPCIICQCDAEATTWECDMSWGLCGHAFHAHCIQRWLKTRQVCPLDNQPWVEKKDWNDSQQ